MKRATPFLILAILFIGCQKNPLTIYRPNARTTLEQRSYNLLRVSSRIAAANYVAVIGADGELEKAAALVALLEDVDTEITKMFQRGPQ